MFQTFRRHSMLAAWSVALYTPLAVAQVADADFNDLSLAVLRDQAGGSNLFTDVWGDTGTLWVVTGDLVAPPGTNHGIVQSGPPQSVRGNFNEPRNSTRPLIRSLAGTISFSFLINVPDEFAVGGLSFNVSGWLGNQTPRVVADGLDLLLDGPDASDVLVPSTFTAGQTALVHGTIEVDYSGNLDRLSVWVDPDLAALGTPLAVLDTVDLLGGSLTRVGLVSYQIAGTLGATLDALTLDGDPFDGGPGADWFLTFSDEFEGAELDPNLWRIAPERPHAVVEDGLLRLITVREGNGWIEGRINTHTYMQRYGYYESRYRIGTESGLNNAFWLNTASVVIGNRFDRMEVDIQETHFPGELNATLHDWSPVHQVRGRWLPETGLDLHLDFYTYAFEWKPDNSMIWYFEGVPFATLSNTTVNDLENLVPLELLFSTKVIPFAGPPGPNLEGTSMDVDYVRVYQLPGWTGEINGNWGSAGNWYGDDVPATNDAAIFNQPSANTNITLAADKAVREIYFDGSTTPAYTISGPYTLTLGAISGDKSMGGVVMNYAVTQPQTINCDIIGENQMTFANYSQTPGADLTLNGALDSVFVIRPLYLGGLGRININGPISDRFGDIELFGAAEVHLANTNQHTGVITVGGGTLVIRHEAALTGSLVEIASGASFALGGSFRYLTPPDLHISGSGDPDFGAALAAHGRGLATHDGGVSLDKDSTIGSGKSGGTLIVNGAINASDTSSHLLTISGNGTTELAGTVGNRIAGITKVDSGTAILSGINFYAGETIITEGTLALTDNGSTGLSKLIDVWPNTIFDVTGLTAGAFQLFSGTTLRINGQAIGNLVVGSGRTVEGGGTLDGHLTAQSGATIRPGDPNVVDAIGSISLTLTASEDVRIRSNNLQQGGGNWLAIGPTNTNDVFRSIMQFSLTDIPAGAILTTNPVLTLTSPDGEGNSISSNPTIELHELNNTFLADQATWTLRRNRFSWNTPGGDLGALLDTITGPDPDTWKTGDKMIFSSRALRDAVEASLGGDVGLLVMTDTEALAQRSFFWIAPSEHLAQPGPTLELTYALTQALPALRINQGLTLNDGVTLAYSLGNQSTRLQIAGGTLTGSSAAATTIDVGEAGSVPPNVYTLIDWRGTTASGVEANDFVLSDGGVSAEFVVFDERLFMLLLDSFDRFDFDFDGDVDAADLDRFSQAMNGPEIATVPPTSTIEDFVRADTQRDHDIDLRDFANMQRVATN